MTTDISSEARAYNYADFPPETDRSDFQTFPEHVKAGQQARDFEATMLEGGLAPYPCRR